MRPRRRNAAEYGVEIKIGERVPGFNEAAASQRRGITDLKRHLLLHPKLQ